MYKGTIEFGRGKSGFPSSINDSGIIEGDWIFNKSSTSLLEQFNKPPLFSLHPAIRAKVSIVSLSR